METLDTVLLGLRLGLQDEDGLCYDADPGDDVGGVGVDVENEQVGVDTAPWREDTVPVATTQERRRHQHQVINRMSSAMDYIELYVRLGAPVGCLGHGDEQGLCCDPGSVDVDVEEGGVGVPKHEGTVAAVHEGRRQHQHDLPHPGLHRTIVK